MAFRFSLEAAANLDATAQMIEDLRNAPVNGRKTEFRLSQYNALAYTFDAAIPGWGPPGLTSMPFKELVTQPIANAKAEGVMRYGSDFKVEQAAVSKVTGDIYETVTSAILWNAAARWNSYMRGGSWPAQPRYKKPAVKQSPANQVAVLNLPRRYDWVRLLEPKASKKIQEFRTELSGVDLSMPTSTPDLALVGLPQQFRGDNFWATPVASLSRSNQTLLGGAKDVLEGRITPDGMMLAMALKTSLRSDRLYQPLYEANIMKFLLEGNLGASEVDFEVHVLSYSGTRAVETYSAATLYSVASPNPTRAVRELYVPKNAGEVVQRFYDYLEARFV